MVLAQTMMRQAVVTFVFVSLLVGLAGCSQEKPATKASTDGSAGTESDKVIRPEDVPLPEYHTGRIRVYTPEADRLVLIDGHLARDEAGEPLNPPCEVVAELGMHTVTLTAAGLQDISQDVAVSESADVDFPALSEAGADSTCIASAPLFSARVGVPIAIEAVNSSGAEFDPYLSRDGLTLWFAGDRADGGRAIYFATRASIWDNFGSPEALLVTRGPSVPGSPSLSGDGLHLYYAVPEEARIWSVSRADVKSQFLDKETVLFDETAESTWPAAQVLPDELRTYWIERKGDKLSGFAAVRKTMDDDFSSAIPYPLPGLVPALSADGLRQYVYDGHTLKRSRRAKLADDFSALEEVMSLQLLGYVPAEGRRQYCVSGDQQWMVYCDDPAGKADLFLVRLSESPGWGVAPVGKPIPPKQMVAETNGTPAETETKPAEMESERPDPRTVALPYAEYVREWKSLVAARNYDAAETLTRKSLERPDFADSRAVLETDLKILQDLQRFKMLAQAACERMKAGDEFSFKTIRVKLLDYKDGVLRFQAGKQEQELPFFELPAASLSLLVAPAISAGDADAARSRQAFLLFDKGAIPTNVVKRIDDKSLRRTILGYATGSLLHEAELEFARDNYPAGFEIIRKIEEDFPDTEATKRAAAMRSSLYAKSKWEMVGKRKWQTDPATGEFRASEQRVDDSYLKSPKPMKNYELRFEWRTFGSIGQGGVYFHYPGTGKLFRKAFKIQLANDAGVNPDSYSSGSLFGIEAPTENPVKPQPEWNTLRMVVKGSDVIVWINGKQVLKTLALSDEIPEEGYVLLDGVIGGIAYRRILLFEIP